MLDMQYSILLSLFASFLLVIYISSFKKYAIKIRQQLEIKSSLNKLTYEK